MKHIYEKTAKYTKFGSILLVGIYIVLLIVFRDVMWKDFENHFAVGFTLFVLYSSSFFFQHASEKLPDEKKVDSNYYSADFPVQELNFQRDVSLIPQTYLVSSTGERLYSIEPSKDQPVRRKLSAITIFKAGMFFPITYDLKTMDKRLVCTFTIHNKLKFIQMKVHDHIHTHVTTIVMPPMSLKNRAIIFDANNEKLLQMEAKSMYGDIDVNDLNGNRLATYRFGIFPYATHPAFEVQAMNVHISLAHNLPHTERLTFTALFYYWTASQ
ncbi:hypothetical protein KD050_10185 [Psychrobacillus sp. INOP01]|uniref:hypothetical protein n=1 Tax=Psychrobacillus sp. INOP01 TaxID=2829187 RepID=UPI001BAB4F8B|nr:hypothetical protein [Psychrobacillus sp. INOP01]QUG43554.1 hypothetical protein KD050_10185 [Psychrobacillus sp. INOP01]